MMHCYYCRAVVDEIEHRDVRRVLEELWMTALFDDMEGVTPEDSFVHMTPIADEVDAENIKPAE